MVMKIGRLPEEAQFTVTEPVYVAHHAPALRPAEGRRAERVPDAVRGF